MPKVRLKPSRSQLQNFVQATADSKHTLPAQLAKWHEAQDLRNQQLFRHEVVSEELCNEALKQLTPSLRYYKGCTIFDCNPGGGLWSRKIHEFLRPKTHLLLEPELARFRPFLDPLVQHSDSTYRYEDTTQYAYVPERTSWMSALTGIAPYHIEKPCAGRNPRILVLANTAQRHGWLLEDAVTTGSTSKPEQFLFEFLRMLYYGVGPHIAGPARLLMWCFNDAKGTMLPRSISGRKDTALQAEDLYDIHEVVGSLEYTGQKRFAEIEAQSALTTGRCLAHAWMIHPELMPPEHRRSDLNRDVMRAVTLPAGKVGRLLAAATPEETDNKSNMERDLQYLHQQQRKYYEGVIQKYKKVKKGEDKRLKTKSREYEEIQSIQQRLEELANQPDNNLLKRGDDIEHMVIALSDQHEAERQLTVARRTVGDVPAAEQNLELKKEEVERRLSKVQTRNKTARVASEIDNIEALRHDPPLLAWDQRKREPLETSADEFWPPQKLALLDMQPRPTTKIGVESIYNGVLFRNLKTVDLNPIDQALETVAHGAAAALLPHCPTLFDPLQGGRVNIDDLRVRMLTHKMAHELQAAWEKWELKPNEYQLLNRKG